MTTEQLYELAHGRQLPGGPAEVVETHVSWVLLNDQYAYKIKKPVRLSFLDFSTLEKRHYFLERELVLNQRFSPEVYHQLIPIFAKGQTEVLDYALQMQRLDNRLEMSRLLEQKAVTEDQLRQLAQTVAAFHQSAERVWQSLPPERMKADFEDLLVHEDKLKCLSLAEADQLPELIHRALNNLESLAPLIAQRARDGYRIDGHGDLHAGNIFLYPEGPILFDCLEFRDDWRQIDVLDELAFLLLDLDYYAWPRGHEVLADAYFAATRQPTEEERSLLAYFLAYRANVRLKVRLIRWAQSDYTNEDTEQSACRYAALLYSYCRSLDKQTAIH